MSLPSLKLTNPDGQGVELDKFHTPSGGPISPLGMHPMAAKTYNMVWRVLAGIISLLTVFVVARAAVGMSDGLDWSGAIGALLVLVLLPAVAITGRVPARIERWTRLMSRDR